jgi:hypothetical protein
MPLFIWILLCLLFQVASGAETVQKSSIPEKISGWIKVAPPHVGSEAWNAAVGSEYEWTVDTKEGLPVAHRRDPKAEQASAALPLVVKRARGPHPEPGEIRSIKVVDGWLVSYNPEDGGGSLWWYGADGRQGYKVSNDQIRQFLPARRGLFALEGLEQVKESRGQIVQLQRNAQGQWTSTRFFDLERAPEVGMVESGGFLVCTIDSLVRVSLDKTQTVLLPNAFWTGLSPRSIAVSERGDIYLGMRHGVAQIYPFNRAYVAEWFLPNLEFLHAKPK